MVDPGLPVFGTFASWLLTLLILAASVLYWDFHTRVKALEQQAANQRDARIDGGTPPLPGDDPGTERRATDDRHPADGSNGGGHR